ncbi:MAG: pilus assembly protein PilB [Verrucomicrobia bacterium]|jgi:type IV pilus assembly protein PilB|nr:pilus assembly protein PilB [Verrucomicrobiota bacterium]
MSDTLSDPLLGLLRDQQMLDDLQLEEVSEALNKGASNTIAAIKELGFMDGETVLQIVADYLGAPVLPVEPSMITDQLKEIMTAETAQQYQCIPVGLEDEMLQVAFVDPLDPSKIDELGYVIPFPIQVMVADPAEVEKCLSEAYGGSMNKVQIESGIADILSQIDGVIEDVSPEDAENTVDSNAVDLSLEDDDMPIVKFVNLVLLQAVQDRASDIHFEPFEDEFKIRYRVDGALYEMTPPPLHLAMPVASRLKIMANLDISERRLPQDGRISCNINGRQVDLRLSTLPTQFGESVVLRVLDRSAVNLGIEHLGFPGPIMDYVQEAIQQPNGIFVVTGPTGCGKTTTLYSCLRKINKTDLKLLTVEDPVEFDIEGIMQVPVKESVGMTFAKALRAFLRQDPDVIMVGEMRDLETSQIAIQASLTGHLVISTLHTNDAPGAVTRLVDMGVEPFLISSTLMGVLAQRLVRTICKDCKTGFEPTEQQIELLSLKPEDVAGKELFYGSGCGECNDTGYKGRKGIYELLRISESVRSLINERAPTVVIRQKAIEEGMITLREDGLRSIFNGDSSIEEVMKYT